MNNEELNQDLRHMSLACPKIDSASLEDLENLISMLQLVMAQPQINATQAKDLTESIVMLKAARANRSPESEKSE